MDQSAIDDILVKEVEILKDDEKIFLINIDKFDKFDVSDKYDIDHITKLYNIDCINIILSFIHNHEAKIIIKTTCLSDIFISSNFVNIDCYYGNIFVYFLLDINRFKHRQISSELLKKYTEFIVTYGLYEKINYDLYNFAEYAEFIFERLGIFDEIDPFVKYIIKNNLKSNTRRIELKKYVSDKVGFTQVSIHIPYFDITRSELSESELNIYHEHYILNMLKTFNKYTNESIIINLLSKIEKVVSNTELLYFLSRTRCLINNKYIAYYIIFKFLEDEEFNNSVMSNCGFCKLLLEIKKIYNFTFKYFDYSTKYYHIINTDSISDKNSFFINLEEFIKLMNSYDREYIDININISFAIKLTNLFGSKIHYNDFNPYIYLQFSQDQEIKRLFLMELEKFKYYSDSLLYDVLFENSKFLKEFIFTNFDELESNDEYMKLFLTKVKFKKSYLKKHYGLFSKVSLNNNSLIKDVYNFNTDIELTKNIDKNIIRSKISIFENISMYISLYDRKNYKNYEPYMEFNMYISILLLNKRFDDIIDCLENLTLKECQEYYDIIQSLKDFIDYAKIDSILMKKIY
jgi:hypothetical protein